MVDRTEKEKMISGQLYRSGDALLRKERTYARGLLKAFNDTVPDEIEKRTGILTELLGTLGKNAEIEPPFHCDYGYNIHAGNSFYANFNCIFLDCAPIFIGDNTLLGPGVHLYTATHPLAVEERNIGLESAMPIIIEDNVWICGGAIINPGVTIRKRTTIGAGSVVTRNILPDVFAAGNPCKAIRSLVLPQQPPSNSEIPYKWRIVLEIPFLII